MRFESNEPCRKGCGRQPNGRTYGTWGVHEATCDGSPPKILSRFDLNFTRASNDDPVIVLRRPRVGPLAPLCPHGTVTTLKCFVCFPVGTLKRATLSRHGPSGDPPRYDGTIATFMGNYEEE